MKIKNIFISLSIWLLSIFMLHDITNAWYSCLQLSNSHNGAYKNKIDTLFSRLHNKIYTQSEKRQLMYYNQLILKSHSLLTPYNNVSYPQNHIKYRIYSYIKCKANNKVQSLESGSANNIIDDIFNNNWYNYSHTNTQQSFKIWWKKEYKYYSESQYWKFRNKKFELWRFTISSSNNNNTIKITKLAIKLESTNNVSTHWIINEFEIIDIHNNVVARLWYDSHTEYSTIYEGKNFQLNHWEYHIIWKIKKNISKDTMFSLKIENVKSSTEIAYQQNFIWKVSLQKDNVENKYKFWWDASTHNYQGKHKNKKLLLGGFHINTTSNSSVLLEKLKIKLHSINGSRTKSIFNELHIVNSHWTVVKKLHKTQDRNHSTVYYNTNFSLNKWVYKIFGTINKTITTDTQFSLQLDDIKSSTLLSSSQIRLWTIHLLTQSTQSYKVFWSSYSWEFHSYYLDDTLDQLKIGAFKITNSHWWNSNIPSLTIKVTQNWEHIDGSMSDITLKKENWDIIWKFNSIWNWIFEIKNINLSQWDYNIFSKYIISDLSQIELKTQVKTSVWAKYIDIDLWKVIFWSIQVR